jgi:hypothetical protein
MKYDSYSRFLKSQMYKDSIVYEMESKPLNQLINIFTSSTLMPPQPTNNNTGNSIINVMNTNSNVNSNVNNITSNNNVNTTNEIRKDKKRSTILPWTKGMENLIYF